MVATLARARGVTIVDLAAALGMHRNRLADKIAGRRDWREHEILAVAAFFDVEPGRLFADPMVLLTGGSSSAWTPNIAGQPHLFLVETCEACGENLGHERSFGRMHSRCVERLVHAA